MNNFLFRKKRLRQYISVSVILVLIAAGCSVNINSVVQPASVTGGQTMTVTLNTTIASNYGQTSNLVVGVLVPKIWHASSNMTMTATSTMTSGDQAMSIIPAGTAAPFANGLDWPTDLAGTIGHAGNLIPDYEWVVFNTNAPYAFPENATVNVVINIQIKVATNNVLFNMAYVVANSTNGLHTQDIFGNPPTDYYASFAAGAVRVNGTGTLMDFVNPQLSSITPGSSLDNDIITIPFASSVAPNALSNASQVYLCATGYTTAGDSIKVCQQTDKTKLTSLGTGNWQMDMWPRGFFNLTANQTLDSLEYYFTDPTGATRVGYGGGSAPFSYTFSCQ
jgi:hypothetical protein